MDRPTTHAAAEPAPTDRPETEKERQKARRAARLAQAPYFPQQQAQIVGRTFEHMRLGHVAQPAQPASASAAGLTDMGKGPFTAFAAPAVQLLPFVGPDPPAVPAKGPLIFLGLSVQTRLFCLRSGM